MSAVGWLNAAALAGALALSFSAVAVVGGRSAAPPAVAAASASGRPQTLTLPDGRRALRDARGAAVALADYRRIASVGLASDALLAELCEPERVVAVSSYSLGFYAYKLGAKPRLKGLGDLEAVIALHPDLVLCSTFGGDVERVARLREAGVTVCDLGEQAGVATLMPNAYVIAELLGAPERAERFVCGFTRRLAAVSAALPHDRAHRRGMYLELIGDVLYGGTLGSSYHDVLTAAAIDDVAAARYRGWPQYRIEEVMALDPEVIVASRGTAERLRRLPGIATLRAATAPDGIIELDGQLLSDPGPAMLDAAEALFAAAYP